MARCVGRSRIHVPHVHHRQATSRVVSWRGGDRVKLRSRWIARGSSGMGVLLGADLFLWSRIHQGLCQKIRLALFRQAAASRSEAKPGVSKLGVTKAPSHVSNGG